MALPEMDGGPFRALLEHILGIGEGAQMPQRGRSFKANHEEKSGIWRGMYRRDDKKDRTYRKGLGPGTNHLSAKRSRTLLSAHVMKILEKFKGGEAAGKPFFPCPGWQRGGE